MSYTFYFRFFFVVFLGHGGGIANGAFCVIPGVEILSILSFPFRLGTCSSKAWNQESPDLLSSCCLLHTALASGLHYVLLSVAASRPSFAFGLVI